MTNYVAIPNADVAVGAPLDTALMTALRDNAIAVGENDSTVPDDARVSLLLDTITVSNGVTSFNSAAGLDLTPWRALKIVINGITFSSTSGTPEVSIGGAQVASGADNVGFGVFEIDLAGGAGGGGAVAGQWGDSTPLAGDTGYDNSTTQLSFSGIASGGSNFTFQNVSGGGDVKIYGLK